MTTAAQPIRRKLGRYEIVAEIARVSGVKPLRKAPASLLKLYGQIAAVIAAITGRQPDVTPELAAITSRTDVTFCSDKAIDELGYHIQPMEVAVRDNYEWLVSEGLL